MRLFKRQKLLLSLVEASGGVLAATDLQKLLFLYISKFEEEPSYKFVPYRFGCFSFQSYADRKTLIKKEMLFENDDSRWEITSLAKAYLDKETTYRAKLFVSRTVPERGKELVAKVYREQPFFASRSEIIEDIFPCQREREEILSSVEIPAGKALFTLGYEGDSIDGYLERLIKNGVRLLCDVRRNPLSRKTGFSKNQLANYCSRVGIEYRHLPELGIPSHRRRELNSQADYDALFKEYEAEDLPLQTSAIRTLLEFLDSHQRIALTCFELEPHSCHRHCVSEAMESHTGCPTAHHI